MSSNEAKNVEAPLPSPQIRSSALESLGRSGGERPTEWTGLTCGNRTLSESGSSGARGRGGPGVSRVHGFSARVEEIIPLFGLWVTAERRSGLSSKGWLPYLIPLFLLAIPVQKSSKHLILPGLYRGECPSLDWWHHAVARARAPWHRGHRMHM